MAQVRFTAWCLASALFGGSRVSVVKVIKLCTIALDFDGTIALNDRLEPKVREAIADARARGIVVIVVTGRILDDLRRVAGELHFADAVVAENGATILFPASGCSRVLAPPVPDIFLEELRREGIPFNAGKAIVDMDASFAPRVLSVIRRLELPLTFSFNRSRMMILPQAVSKATGLYEVMAILRLSPHNAVAIGDAENDHALLAACEFGIAVGWGSERLKATADFILVGDGPPAVADYIRSLSRERQIPSRAKTRRRLLLGYSEDGSSVELAIRGRNVLVAGDSRSGKSWVTGLLCEQLILYGYCLCIVDPEGDYTSLEALPGVTLFGHGDRLPSPRDLTRALRHADVSVVIDLSHVSCHEKLDYMKNVLPALATLRRRTGLPHRIVVDESHYFVHQPGVTDGLDLAHGGYTFVTYRPSQLRKDLLDSTQAVIVTRESDLGEVSALRAMCSSCQGGRTEQEWSHLLESLVFGEAVALPLTEESGGMVRRISLAPRLTPHVRHLAKYIDIPVPKGQSFVFWNDGGMTGTRARSLREFVAAVEHCPVAGLDGHLRRGDFSRWIAGVFGDYPLAATVRQLEDGYRAQGQADVGVSLAQAIRARYEFLDPACLPENVKAAPAEDLVCS
jgi:hydroxymethylpyrimidine pyrophosphatase-like HAD family hydrolase